MRIHTDNLMLGNFEINHAALSIAPGVHVGVSWHRSRSHRSAYEISMTGNSASKPNDRGASPQGVKAASWDEWGVLIGRLYVMDPEAVWGSPKNPIYASAEHFNWATGGRFKPVNGTYTDASVMAKYVLLPADTHKRHSWDYSGDSATGSYHVSECKKCSAIRRHMVYGRDFAELASV